MPLRLSNRILSISIATALAALSSCERENPVPPPPPPTPVAPKPNLAPLGKPPDWSLLEPYQQTITQSDFERLLTTVYAMPGAWATTLQISENEVKIRRESAKPMDDPNGMMTLKFGTTKPQVSRFWRKRAELPPLAGAPPLSGVRIAIDPGHIGGAWAQMEERNFAPVNGPPVREGDLTLITAKLLRRLLEELGATVSLVRNAAEPVTTKRPADFIKQAREELTAMGIDPDHPPDKSPANSVRWQSQKLFYRTAEIRARAKLVNESLRPDFVICIHFNASGSSWGKPGEPNFSLENHLHLILNGGFGFDELLFDDQRQELLLKLLSGVHEEELGLATEVSQSLAATTELPPFIYLKGALPVGETRYLWARNLLANRLYACPVIYCEPYVMNNQEIATRLQEGDYEGERLIGGKNVSSIFREYANGVANGLRNYFQARN